VKTFKINQVQSKILAWGRANYQNYPWRDVEDPWLALLAEVLLQRTNATHVFRYYEEVCKALPDHLAVLKASKTELEELAGKFGLKRRVKTLVELAHYVDYLDYYPDQLDELTKVYGVGHYTASAYLSLHMNIRAVLLDANIVRWLSRIQGKQKPVDIRRNKYFWSLADRLTPTKNFKEYNYAVLDFTMLICRPRKPECHKCPILKYCTGHIELDFRA